MWKELLEEADKHAVRELYLYATNDGDLYRQMLEPIYKNYSKKFKKDKYDRELAVKGLMRFVLAAAKKYSKDHSTGNDWQSMFPKDVREEVAKEIEDDFYQDAKSGNLYEDDSDGDMDTNSGEESDNPEDVITMDVPLFIRMLEFAREDAANDLDLHDVAERCIDAEGRTLTMDDYESIVGGLETKDQMAESQSMTMAQVRKMFKTDILPDVIDHYGPNDKPVVRTAFNDFVDSLHKDGQISDRVANNITLGMKKYE